MSYSCGRGLVVSSTYAKVPGIWLLGDGVNCITILLTFSGIINIFSLSKTHVLVGLSPLKVNKWAIKTLDGLQPLK